MKRPILNEVSLADVMESMLGGGKPSVNITMSRGQWDGFLQAAYDAGHNLIEMDNNEIPGRAYRKKLDAYDQHEDHHHEQYRHQRSAGNPIAENLRYLLHRKPQVG